MTVCPCRLCNEPTLMLGTRLCDGCYELWRRMKASPKLVKRIMEEEPEFKDAQAPIAPLTREQLEALILHIEAMIANRLPGSDLHEEIARHKSFDNLTAALHLN